MGEKHTPGPWEIHRTSHLNIYIGHSHDRPNRTPGYLAEVRRFTTDHEQVEANARLIAAAPELLDALKALEEAARQVQCGEMDKQSIDVERRKARAAIAKATGEQP